ncbi:hypothetical protein sphantq_02517 [Sphingobium sp. AntQ-1]|uniref:ThiF family adenylyltransferase n=1 Tax=Sphingobium sp. AntQ-1 TaxID=2930091 RepID=UPI00234FB2B7|nr:ThiF family adenylyltransferase [Sphingobium sp. AntQ-1]WCP14075.1 hypothetical protein sphantq_02517 [Sphingobium sp. AntQ-1]
MSRQLISRNPDLARLEAEGYDVSVEGGFLVVRGVPFVDAARRVRRGLVISRLDLAGDRTIKPRDHFVWFAGGEPCDALGRPIGEMVNGRARSNLGGGLIGEYMLCSRAVGGEYPDFHAKITTFVNQVTAHVHVIDPTATARSGHVVAAPVGRSPFAYVDTASSRHGIGAFSDRLAGQSIGIVGLGGTGGYVLDLVAKCPVSRIHLFDDDRMEQHNAFRAPGAASIDDLRGLPSKVAHFEAIYSRMHVGIVAHEERLDRANLHMLDHLDFVFLCVDSAASRSLLVAEMERRGLPFVDVGIGMQATAEGLLGTVRVTTVTPDMPHAGRPHPRIPMEAILEDDPYGSAAQVADLNSLAATLAVMRWKRRAGFYLDLAGEHHSVFTVDGNHILGEDHAVGAGS